MTQFSRNIGRTLGALVLAGLMPGCEDLKPYRTAHPTVAPVCDPDAAYMVPEACRASVVERSGDYELFFTEFTDQGLQYSAEPPSSAAARQIDTTLDGLKRIAATPGVKGVSVVVFVHGWKHNASHDDANVRSFRALLRSAALFEQARNSGYRVVGVYVGWRGLSLRDEPLANLSFWTRKATALRVAQGSPRELFNRLRSFKCAQNRASAREQGRMGDSADCDEAPSSGLQRPKVRMIMIGHSFGAWILYNAVAGSLIESLTYARDTDDPNAVNMRYADMVVLLIAAFEASRYTPLHRVATSSRYHRYQAPLLVSVTTAADWATRRAFPVGRFINTVFENAAGDEERVATKYTMGHIPQYITHELHAVDEQPAECANWAPLRRISDPAQRRRQAEENRRAEEANINNFPGVRQALETGWQRAFCGGARLKHVNYDPNSVIWNVRTDRTIMNGHNDIDNDRLFEFVRQLYHDTVLYPLPTGSNVVPPARPGPK